jgi:sarcosine oxidase subunit alpha
MQSNRLPAGGRIDRNKLLSFRFNGKSLQGFAGDTLASALLANDVKFISRSIKYHRPRGIMGIGPEEPNALLQLEDGARTLANCRATQVELYDGLTARSVNGWPSLHFDLLALNGFFAPLLPSGFYYKTFMWPKRYWMNYEHFIRKISGSGFAPNEEDPDRYDKVNAHCDVLVIGAGAAGLAAALESGRTGARVILADEQPEFGGQLLNGREKISGRPAMEWVERAVAELAAMPEVRLLSRSSVFGYYDHNFLAILERVTDHLPPAGNRFPRQKLWHVRAKQVVIASGSFERPLVFHNNDRPGIMLASAISAYLNRYAVRPGVRAAVFTNNNSAYQTAMDLLDTGTNVTAMIDSRNNLTGELPAKLHARGVTIYSGSVVTNTFGSSCLEAVELAQVSADRSGVGGKGRRLPCDLLAVSGGWSPALDMHCQSGGKARFDAARACFVPGQIVQAERSAGSCNGSFGLNNCLLEGSISGAEAAYAAGFGDGRSSLGEVSVSTTAEPGVQPLWIAPSRFALGRGPKQFVDFQNDTSVADIVMAARENFHSIEHVKRYTLLGFGTDQGKLSNVNGIGVLSAALGKDMAAIGTTTFRPAYTPVTFGALAGRDIGALADPLRKTPMDRWHEKAGAMFENVGQWRRPWYYPQPHETLHDAVRRECLATQRSVGVLDASTLGKIDVQGSDAAEFLNRIYTNNKSILQVGRCSYGLMLGEDGMVFDDGVTARVGEAHFFLTTTTGGAARVMSWLERWLQTEWPGLKVYLTSVTDHWATISINGPSSRRLLSELSDDIDFSKEAFAFMSFRQGHVAGVPARVFRISFSGELAYEVNIPANYGLEVWEKIFEVGKKYEMTPYGTETMHVLRAEKGYVIVGQDTDGSMTPGDLGMDWILSKKKDFLGRRSLSRSDTVRPGRKQLIGLLPEFPEDLLPEGGQIIGEPRFTIPAQMLGHVTSSYLSARIGRSIALGMLKGGRSRIGNSVYIPLRSGRVIKATVTEPVFYDPEGKLQNA